MLWEKLCQKKNPHLGSTFESYLKEIGIYEEVQKSALKQIIAERPHNEFDEEEEAMKN